MPKVPVVNELQIGLNKPTSAAYSSGGVQTARAEASRVNSGMGTGSRLRPAEINRSQLVGDPGALSTAIGRVSSQLGQTMQNIAIDVQQKANAVRVTSAENEYVQFLQDQKHNQDYGWENQKGEAALYRGKDGKPLYEEFGEAAQKRMQEIMENLSNEPQKAAFAQYAQQQMLSQREQVMSHMNREFNAHLQETTDAGISIRQNAITTGDLKDIDESLGGISKLVTQYAEMNGKGADWVQNTVRDKSSSAIAGAVMQRIESGAINEAAGIMNRYSGLLNGKDQYEARTALQRAISIQRGSQAGQSLFQRGVPLYDRTRDGDPYASLNQGLVEQTYLASLVSAESGGRGDAKNSTSSAYGYAQFIDSTWKEFGNSAEGAAIKGNMSNQEWLQMRSNRQAAEAATLWYAKYNKTQYYDKAGVPLNNATAYLGHFLGGAGAAKVYTADPNTPIDQLVSKDVMNANKSILTGKTAGDVVLWAARKMGVKGDIGAPAARPPDPQLLGDKQAKLLAKEYFAGDPDAAQAAIDTYSTLKGAYDEQVTAAKNERMNMALDVVYSGKELKDIPSSIWAAMSPQEQDKVITARNSRETRDEAVLKNENFDLYMKLSSPKELEKTSEDALMALRPDLGLAYTKELINKKRALEKSQLDEAGKQKHIDLEDTVQKSIIKEAFGIDPWQLDKDEKEQYAYAQFSVQQSINYWVTQYKSSGQELDQQTLTQHVLDDMRAKIQVGHTWRGKAKLEQPYLRSPLEQPDRDTIEFWRVEEEG